MELVTPEPPSVFAAPGVVFLFLNEKITSFLLNRTIPFGVAFAYFGQSINAMPISPSYTYYRPPAAELQNLFSHTYVFFDCPIDKVGR